jgi:hypothetical protein
MNDRRGLAINATMALIQEEVRATVISTRKAD